MTRGEDLPRLLARASRLVPLLLAAIPLHACGQATGHDSVHFRASTGDRSFVVADMSGSASDQGPLLAVSIDSGRVSFRIPDAERARDIGIRATLVKGSRDNWRVLDSSRVELLDRYLSRGGAESSPRGFARQVQFRLAQPTGGMCHVWLAFQFTMYVPRIGRLSWWAHADTSIFERQSNCDADVK